MADHQAIANLQQNDDVPQPFRFLDLPLELQRKILIEYFKKPWSVTPTDRKKIRGLFLENITLDRFDMNLNILLVNSHLHQEAVNAISACKNGNYYMHEASVKLLETRSWFFPAIDQAVIDIEDWEDVQHGPRKVIDTVKLAREQFENLKRLDMKETFITCFDNQEPFDDDNDSAQATLVTVLEGANDARLCSWAKTILDECLGVSLSQAVGSIPFVFDTYFCAEVAFDIPQSFLRRWNYQADEEYIEHDEYLIGDLVNLWMQFEVLNNEYRIVSKWLTDDAECKRLEAVKALELLAEED